jgi:hypothetical protein
MAIAQTCHQSRRSPKDFNFKRTLKAIAPRDRGYCFLTQTFLDHLVLTKVTQFAPLPPETLSTKVSSPEFWLIA